MNPFKEMQKVEQRVRPKAQITIELALNCTLVWVDGETFQIRKRSGDGVGVHRETGQTKNIEVKNRQNTYGRDVLLEIWSNYLKKRGWALTSTADLFAEYREDTGRLVVLDRPKTTRWVQAHFEEYTLQKQTKTRQLNDTRFIIVPVADLERAGLVVYKNY